jgi:hypothetical protein
LEGFFEVETLSEFFRIGYFKVSGGHRDIQDGAYSSSF